MGKTKSKVVKSKSSNSTVTKYNPMDNTSGSNATFQTLSAKKRGVYVEKNPTKEALNASGTIPKEPVKAPKRPSRGQKRFLASVLSLLSKSSAATQYPDEVTTPIKKSIKTNKAENNAIEPEKRKKKYKSKVLNSSNYPFDTFEVLQSKKNVVLTPSIDLSNDEEFEDIKWAEFLPRLVQPDSEELKIEKDKKLSHLVKEVAEGRMIKEKRVIINADEPPTLVSENKKHTTKDPGFYNFFVDLLETTFSVYNIKSECDIQGVIQSGTSSKVAFEIDEAVANKLNVAPEVSRQPSTHSYKERQGELSDYFQLLTPNQTSKKNKTYKSIPSIHSYIPKYKAPKPEIRSHIFPRSVSMRQPPLLPQTASMAQKKSFYKKNSKQILLNKLKEQLSMDNQSQEESQSLFQALKVLAKNKRKTQKTLRFEKTPDELSDGLKTRKLVSSRRSKIKRESVKILPSLPSDYKKMQKRSVFSEGLRSNHSLEVVNIDYDKYVRLKKHKEKNNSPTSYFPFSPVESVNDYYRKSYAPMIQQVFMRVKSVNPSKSKEFIYERDEA